MPETAPAAPSEPRFDPSTVEAAVFDIGGVFLYPHHNQVSGVLDAMGFARPDDVLEYRRAHHAGVATLSARFVEVNEYDPSFWIDYDRSYSATLGVPEEAAAEFSSRIDKRAWDWLHEENVASFHELHASGLPLAIVSNNSGAAPSQMIDHGVCWVNDYHDLPTVAAIIDSSLVGVAKPDPAIMAPALYALDLPADRVVYIGDTVHADINGATAAGMQSVQLDPFDQHTEYGHTRLPDLAALNVALGL